MDKLRLMLALMLAMLVALANAAPEDFEEPDMEDEEVSKPLRRLTSKQTVLFWPCLTA